MSFESEFMKGVWEWDDKENGIVFKSADVHMETKVDNAKVEQFPKSSACTHTDLTYRFNDSLDIWEQMDFKRNFQRHILPDKPDIVTLRDVKDVALFQVTTRLTSEFIDLFHTQECDRLCRALILYFQLYLHVCEQLKARYTHDPPKLRHTMTASVEASLRDDLATLRSVVGREYSTILLGTGDLHKFHHMANHLRLSAPERDLRVFEPLYQLATRTVWIALARRSLHSIEQEARRLFRSELFTRQRHNIRHPPKDRTILEGETCDEGKLNTKSPLLVQLHSHRQDYRLLGIGHLDIPSEDPRIGFLKAAYTVPEEKLKGLGIRVGILGLPRREFTTLLFPTKHHMFSFESTISKESKYTSRDIPIGGPPEDIPDSLPSKEGEFHTHSYIKELHAARDIWRAHQLKYGN